MTAFPDSRGYFGRYGGRFVPEVLISPLYQLESAYENARNDPRFQTEYDDLCRSWAGRPTPLYEAAGLTRKTGGATILLKREDLAHTGAHKINNALGQALLARRMGKHRIVAETGAGQHGVATAAACALLNLECIVYMGAEDIDRQALNVQRMKLCGAKVEPVSSGSKTLKDAINEAIRDWITNINTTYYLLGSVVGPHPYPLMVRNFQSIIGKETKEQMRAKFNRLPDTIIACVGGGSNAIGIFHPFLEDKQIKLIGIEAAGKGLDTGEHGATLARGRIGILHGTKSYVMQDKNGQIAAAHSIAPGLDYPGVGPEHSYLKDNGRVQYRSVTDKEAIEAFDLLARTEGILPALESAHAISHGVQLAAGAASDKFIVICLSGRGDKDLEIVMRTRNDRC
jgi:tryptophan synthase beta chain